MGEQHWVCRTAIDLMKKHDKEIITCATGISPSGIIHAGNLREVLTSDFVYRALQSLGAESRLMFSWDDFDRFRKVPVGVPDNFTRYIGMPYCDIPDPFGEFESYAKRYETIFEESAKKLGINAQFIQQHKMYRSGAYDNQIKYLLERREEIARILARNMTQGMTETQIKEYFPIAVYSRFTGKDNTEVIRFHRDTKIDYLCNETGKTDTIDFTIDRIVKLPWKIDWPMRWKFERVHFEPGGADHASPQGSYDVGSQFAREIFDMEPPKFIRYQFVRIKGINGKMSGSKGNVFSPAELLSIYPPEIVRWLYCRVSPDSMIDFAFDTDVIRIYDEFDKRRRFALQSLEEVIVQEIDLSLPEQNYKLSSKPISFRQISGLGDSVNFNVEKVQKLLSGSDFDEDNIKERLEKSKNWLDEYNPELRTKLLDSVNLSHYLSLNSKQKEQMAKLREVICRADKLSVEKIESEVYEIPKNPNSSEEENRESQKDFFRNAYLLILGKERGPRLPTFIWASDKEKLKTLTDFSNDSKITH